MSPLVKKITALLCVCVLCVHFILVINYTHCFAKDDHSRLDKLSAMYVNPFFHQSWQMFVPVPKNNYHLFVRVHKDQTWSDWEDLFSEKIVRHQANRLSGDELISLLYSSVIAHAYLQENFRVFGDEPDDLNFKILTHAVKNDLQYQQNRSFDSYELLVVVSGHDTHYSNYYKHLH